MKRILLTGASGFIGSYVLERVKTCAAYEIHATSFSDMPHRETAIQWHETDLLDDTQTQKLIDEVHPHTIIHCAWAPIEATIWDSQENDLWLEASTQLFKYAAAKSVKRIISLGSSFEYNWNDVQKIGTTPQLSPLSRYGICKYKLSKNLRSIAQDSQISYAWLRVFFVYGPRQPRKKLIPAIISSLLKGKK